ncbi:Maf family protein [Citromicrobium bathyomarinum]|uniref:Maf family protein n=1 Tax=Sphingomonadales TaxID=204457 RepID=UPI000C4239E7|nr:Maf family protein [Citromicrobium sp.]MBO80822.1 septum formation protein Maf [Citromicrobium sp.]|tara:strand:- start:38324 stop:38911 length:588 start_codon:yes stop_codon:yes gene_type:complete
MSLILASNSASRRAMLQAAGVEVDCVGADVDERALEAEMADAPPAEIAQALAAAKASAVSADHPDRFVLGGDSLVVVDGQRFDKPSSREEAAEHLRFFSGKVLHLHSAAALASGGRIVWLGEDAAALHVRDLGEDFIAAYLAAEWPEVGQTVGVFRIEAMGVQLFDRIFGDHFTILGMPLLQVLGALREQGVIPA